MFIITCQQGETYGLGNNANPDLQISCDKFGNVLFFSHYSNGERSSILGCYQSPERAAEITSAIIAKFHAYKKWLAAGHVAKSIDDIKNFDALKLNRFALPAA